MDRYRIALDPTRRFWVIYDMVWLAMVELPHTETGELQRLEWGELNRHGAERWLAHCVKVWGCMPQRDQDHPMPLGLQE